MYVTKICFRRDEPLQLSGLHSAAAEMAERGYRVHVQQMDNFPYQRWMQNSKPMQWNLIVDVFQENGCSVRLDSGIRDCLTSQGIALKAADIYGAKQMTYKRPVSDAEIITSCYLWNYQNPEALRKEKMEEHFLMEQKQIYYDYVAFQSVDAVLTPGSPIFDFFFESHVSIQGGIDTIYAKPALNGMREHSKAFLNTDTRQLSFGRVVCYGES